MSTSQALRVGSVLSLVFLTFAIIFIGSQRTAHADPLGSDIVCEVYAHLTALGQPIHPMYHGECPGEVTPPPPAPSPTPPPPAEEEEESPALPQCSDGIDNDGDGLVDNADPGCHTDFDASNASSYDPNLNSEAAVAPQCSDGIDNDGDGLVDSADPGCYTDFDASNASSYDPNLNNEAAVAPQCSDGIDNDGDGLIDMDDPGCSGASDNDETNSSSGGGGGGGGGSKKTTASTSTPVSAEVGLGFSTTTESCDRYLTAFIKTGQENDADQVRRLQRFLRDFEKASVVENGIYDAATVAAVHAFQSKYAADILTPWGAEGSTGYVYLTTRKKVNEIFCNFTKNFFLTVEEEQKIRAAREAALIARPSVPAVPAQPTTLATPESVSTTSQEGGSAVSNVLDFFRGFFGR